LSKIVKPAAADSQSAKQDEGKVQELEAQIARLNNDLQSVKATLSQTQTALEHAKASA
jgi:septal ring factor EnvC (AmiA/AmiB activator)